MVAETDRHAPGHNYCVMSVSDITTISGLLLLIVDVERLDDCGHC